MLFYCTNPYDTGHLHACVASGEAGTPACLAESKSRWNTSQLSNEIPTYRSVCQGHQPSTKTYQPKDSALWKEPVQRLKATAAAQGL